MSLVLLVYLILCILMCEIYHHYPLKDVQILYIIHRLLRSLYIGGEFISNNFTRFLASEDNVHHSSCINHRQNVTSSKTVRYLLLYSTFSNFFWGEALTIVVYVISCIPTTHNFGMSRYEKLYGQFPDYSSLQVFG
ncbi:hypothetical protein LXL04_033073 [Taraxacum kok-saghyz]